MTTDKKLISLLCKIIDMIDQLKSYDKDELIINVASICSIFENWECQVIDLLVTDLKKDEDEVIKEVNEMLDKRNHDISLIEQELQRRYGEDIDENKIKNTVFICFPILRRLVEPKPRENIIY